MVLISTVHYFI